MTRSINYTNILFRCNRRLCMKLFIKRSLCTVQMTYRNCHWYFSLICSRNSEILQMSFYPRTHSARRLVFVCHRWQMLLKCPHNKSVTLFMVNSVTRCLLLLHWWWFHWIAITVKIWSTLISSSFSRKFMSLINLTFVHHNACALRQNDITFRRAL